jgi:hypothetical protein
MPRDKRPNVVVLAGGTAAAGGGGLPQAHASTHQNGGGDEINLTGMSGILADPQPPIIGAGATQAVAGNDARLTNARTPSAHAASHKSGGSDAIALDELAAPTDVTTLNASTSAHGLSPKAVAPAAGLLSVLAIGNGETVRTDQALFDTTNPAALGTAGPGTSKIAARRDHIHALPALDAVAAPTDITTLNSSTSAHGLLKKLSNVSTEFMNGVGNWATPPAGGGWTVISNTATGATNDWAPAGLSGNTLIEWNGAADIALTGLAGGSAGQLVTIKNITAAKLMTFAHASASSSAANRFTNCATSAATPVFTGGWITYQHDGTNWKLVGHEQGAWIVVPYTAGDFTGSGSMTWTVDSGDLATFRYRLDGCTLITDWAIDSSSVGGTPSTVLQIKLPGGFIPQGASGSGQYTAGMMYRDNGGAYKFAAAYITAGGGANKISLYTEGFGTANWTASTNLTGTYGQIACEVT